MAIKGGDIETVDPKDVRGDGDTIVRAAYSLLGAVHGRVKIIEDFQARLSPSHSGRFCRQAHMHACASTSLNASPEHALASRFQNVKVQATIASPPLRMQCLFACAHM